MTLMQFQPLRPKPDPEKVSPLTKKQGARSFSLEGRCAVRFEGFYWPNACGGMLQPEHPKLAATSLDYLIWKYQRDQQKGSKPSERCHWASFAGVYKNHWCTSCGPQKLKGEDRNPRAS